jgi:hypothetical protein
MKPRELTSWDVAWQAHRCVLDAAQTTVHVQLGVMMISGVVIAVLGLRGERWAWLVLGQLALAAFVQVGFMIVANVRWNELQRVRDEERQ